MKVPKEYYDISEALASKILEADEPQDNEILEEWIKADKKNKSLYKKILDTDSFSENTDKISKYSSVKAWKKISSKLKYRKKYYRIFIEITKYAAVILMLVCFGKFLYWYKKGRVEVENVIVSETITKSDKVPQLILANGENINLNKLDNFVIKEVDGTKILKKKKSISYEFSDTLSYKMLYNTMRTPKGCEYPLTFSDGTKVLLNAETKIRYPVKFPKDIREVEISGEAYFDVVKDANRPFIVKVGETKIRVLGTSFNVKAYDNEYRIATTLVTGKVKVSYKNEEAIITPGRQAVVDKNNGKISVKKVDLNLYTSWRKGIYCFKDERVEDVMRTLQRWYNINVFYLDEKSKNVRLGGILKKYNEIGPIIDMLRKTNLVIVKKEGNDIYIAGK